jgi:hypothetical protein
MCHTFLSILIAVSLALSPAKKDSTNEDAAKKIQTEKCEEKLWVKCLDKWLDILSKAVVILGLPIGSYQYFRTKRKEKRDREYGTYNALDLQYVEFQKLCLEHSDLNIFDIADNPAPVLDALQQKKELILFTMLFSIFERAYLLYHRSERSDQWAGWESYIQSYCERENFLHAWEISGKTFDSKFEAFMAKTIANARASN